MRSICNACSKKLGTKVDGPYLQGYEALGKTRENRLGNRLTVGLTTYTLSRCYSTTPFVTRLLAKARKGQCFAAICNASGLHRFPSTGYLRRGR